MDRYLEESKKSAVLLSRHNARILERIKANSRSALGVATARFRPISRLSFAENPSEGNEGSLMDGYEENAVC